MADVATARSLRRVMTPPEVALWQYLRTRPDGFKFRRQHPVDRYVLDFYCASSKVGIEVDGAAHDTGDRPARDAFRDRVLAERGIAVVRFSAVDVMRDLDAVARAILHRCAKPLHHASHGPPPHSLNGEE